MLESRLTQGVLLLDTDTLMLTEGVAGRQFQFFFVIEISSITTPPVRAKCASTYIKFEKKLKLGAGTTQRVGNSDK
jgi:hypothetical protein